MKRAVLFSIASSLCATTTLAANFGRAQFEPGSVALVEASPKGWQERGRFTLDPQTKIRSQRGRIWTHPVISNSKLYLRDQDLIYCYDIKKG